MTSRDDRLLTEAYEEISEAWYNNKSREEDIANRAGKEAHKVAGGKQGLAGVGQDMRKYALGKLGGRMNSKEQGQMNKSAIARTTAIAKSLHDTYLAQLKDLVAKLDSELQKNSIDLNVLPRGTGRDIFKAIRDYQAPAVVEAPVADEQPENDNGKSRPRTGPGGVSILDNLM